MNENLQKILQECLELYKKNEVLRAFEKWENVLAGEIEGLSYEEE